jgi:hypothetical protein
MIAMIATLIHYLAPAGVTSPVVRSTTAIKALVFRDCDGDGYQQPLGEIGLANVATALFSDQSPTGSLGQEDLLLHGMQTDDDGFVIYRNLTAGAYFLMIAVPDGYAPTTPRGRFITTSQDAGGTVLEWWFGLLPPQLPFRQFMPIFLP